MFELEVVQLKTNILRFIAITHNNIEEQSMMDYISRCTHENPQRKIKEDRLKELFNEGATIIQGLKKSHLICGDSEITINDNLFKILPDIIREVEKKIQEEQKRIMENQQKITCAECFQKRERYHHQFIACPCGSHSMLEKDNTAQNKILQKCKLFMRVYGRLGEMMNELNQKIIQVKNQKWLIKEKEEAGKKTSPYDDFVSKQYERTEKLGKLKNIKDTQKSIKVGSQVHLNLEWLMKTNEKYEPKLNYPIARKHRRNRPPKESVDRVGLYRRFYQILRDKSERGEFDFQEERAQKTERGELAEGRDENPEGKQKAIDAKDENSDGKRNDRRDRLQESTPTKKILREEDLI